MSSSTLFRWSGLASLVGGVLLVILSIAESVLFGGQSDSATVMSSAWIVVEVAFVVVEILLITGLVGLYARQAEQTGILGLVAFLLALTGTVLISGVDWSAAFLAPWLAEIAPPEVLDAEPAGFFIVGILLTLVLLALGYFLFGLASLQAKVLPRYASVLLMVGAVLILVMGFLEIGFDLLVLGVAFAWMGYGLWSEPVAEPESIPEVAM
jgi:hypothetical protein